MRPNDQLHAERVGGENEEEFGETIARLSSYTVEEPSPEATTRLASAIGVCWESQAGLSMGGAVDDLFPACKRTYPLGGLVSAMMHIATQTRIFSPAFWVASGLVVFLAAVLGGRVGSADAHPLIFVEPLLAAAGVAFAFRSYGTPMFELEMSCPLSPPQLVFGRLTVVVGYDAGLGLVASPFTDRHGAGIAMFVVAWLIPLALVSLLTLTVMLYAGIGAGLIASLVVWSLQLALREQLGTFYFFASPTALRFGHSCLLALAVAALLLVLVGKRTQAMTGGGGGER